MADGAAAGGVRQTIPSPIRILILKRVPMNMRLHKRVFTAMLVLCATAGLQNTALAAATKGEFGIKGIGATDCAIAVREYKAGTPNAMMYGGWLYGYMTALNQSTPDTFDLATWQDLNTLSNFLIEYCAKNPRMSFAQAVFNMTNALRPMRLKTMSQPVRFKKNDKDFVLYGEVISRMGQTLAAKGFYKARQTDKPVFTDEMSRALAQFQSRNRLPATGEPDQFTLFRLFN
jgi:hypothetical protein